MSGTSHHHMIDDRGDPDAWEHLTDDAHDERVRFTPTNVMGSVLERFERTGLGDLDGEWASVRFDDGETIAVRTTDLVPVTWESGEYAYVPDDDSEYGPVWATGEALENFTADELTEAQPAELVISLDDWRGHYLAADWLSVAADLLQSCQTDPGTYHLDDPERFPLRDRVEAMVHEANESSARYHAHNDVMGADPDQQSEYGSDCSRNDDGSLACPCEWISEVADDMESVLSDLGFVTIWNDGVQTFKVS